MRRMALPLAIALLAVPFPGWAGRARPVFDRDPDCSAMPPAAASASGVTDDGHRVTVEVAVLLDGVKKSRARELMERATTAYDALQMDLVAVSYDRIRIAGDGAGSGGREAVEGGRALAAGKAHFGGARPAGADVVHILTNKDITLPNLGSTPMGVAECAGGVQYADLAFSISEDGPDSYSVGPPGATNVADAPPEAIAHEIGHLLGGLHEHKSCVEGAAPEDATARDPSPCTVMSDVVDLASLRFGLLESSVIRGYALGFADS